MKSFKIKYLCLPAFWLITFTVFFPFEVLTQSNFYNQYYNSINITHPFKEKWSSECDIGSKFSSSSTQNSPFADFAQYSVGAWIHHYFNSRWKFALNGQCLFNKVITDVQPASLEWRLSPQGTYYFHKRDYTLNTRCRFEIRYINQDKNGYSDYYRYRQQLRYLKPFNSRIILAGIWYGIASEELFFKLNTTTNQVSFDRNFLNLGVGYSVTNNMQIELTYLNEFVPRSTNEIYNSVSLSFVFNNFISNFKENVEVLKYNLKADD